MSAGRGTDPLDKWRSFAGKGGIGKAKALCDCIAENHESLSFQKDDEIIVLLRIPERENTYLGSRHGTLGIFAGSNVKFLGPLKRPVKRVRVPTRLGNYSPSMQSPSYDSDASGSHLGRFPNADNTLSPTSPGWLMQHSPYLSERQRTLSASFSAASTTDADNSPSLYEEYQRGRPMEDVLPHATVRPWLFAVAQSIQRVDSNPITRGSSRLSTSETVPQVPSDSNPLRASCPDPQPPSPSTPSNLQPDQTEYSSSIKPSALRSGAMQELTSVSPSFPSPSSPSRPSYTGSLHMPKPRRPIPHRPSFLKHSITSVVTNKSPLRGNGFGDSVLVEEDDDMRPAGNPAPMTANTTVFTTSSVADIISHSPRPLCIRGPGILGSSSPRSPLSPISPNHPMSWSPSPIPVPIFSASPATSPAPHPTHRKSTMSPSNRLASLTKRPRPSSRSGSGSTSCTDAENLPPPPVLHLPARRRTLNTSESAHPASSLSPLHRETLRMGASPSPPKPFQPADTLARLSLDTRPPSSGRVSSGSGGRHSVGSSSRGPMSARDRCGGSTSESSDTAPDAHNLVFASMMGAAKPMPVPRRDNWVHPPPASRWMSRLGAEPIPEESMLADTAHSSVPRSLVENPLQFEFQQAAFKRRRDVRVYSSSESSSSNRLSRSDGESSRPSD